MADCCTIFFGGLLAPLADLFVTLMKVLSLPRHASRMSAYRLGTVSHVRRSRMVACAEWRPQTKKIPLPQESIPQLREPEWPIAW